MSSSNSQESIDKIENIIAAARENGVMLWSENGRLFYRALKGALSEDAIEILRSSSDQIVAHLERTSPDNTIGSRLDSRRCLDRAPLTFSQLAHWNFYGLGNRRAIRQISSATRLRGLLSIDALRQSVSEVVRQHAGLRTRIVVRDEVPVQEISKFASTELIVDDLTAVSENGRDVEVKRLVEEFMLEPIDVAMDPLFGARLLKLHDHEYVLILALEHVIADVHSLNILTRDLFLGYIQALRGRAFSLPTVSVQFAEYAVWQRSTHRSWVYQHGEYWSKRLAGCGRVRFPEDRRLHSAAALGRGIVSVRIDKKVKVELREWCQRKQTTLVLGIFTAYVGLVLRWCNASESVIQYVTNGRVSSKTDNTIGYFASLLCLRVGLFKEDRFVDLLRRVTEEYCRAFEHADFSYIAAQMPIPEFTRNTIFNWLPQGSLKAALSELDGSEDALTISPIHFAFPAPRDFEIDREPFIVLTDGEDEIAGDVYFPLNRFSVRKMESFARCFLVFIETMLRNPEERVNDILLA